MGVYDDLLPPPPTEAPPPGVNPYRPGTEEADWFARQPQRPAAPEPIKNRFDDFQAGFTPPKPVPKEEYRGTMLPFTRDTDGNVRFTPLTAGPIGGVVEAAALPGRVASGEIKVDPSNPTFMGSVLNTALTFNPANPMIRSGDRAFPGTAMSPKNPLAARTPPGGELIERGGAQHKAFRELPIEYNPEHFGVLATQMEQKLVEHGVFPEDAPGLYATVNRLRNFRPPADDPSAVIKVGPANLMSIRDNITNKFSSAAENRKGVGAALELFDNFMEKPPEGAVLAGPAEFGAKIYGEGRANMAAGYRDADLAEIQRASGLRAGSANSGLNLDNTLRGKITSAVLNAKKMMGFTPTEEALLEKVPEGSFKTNTQRKFGNLLGGGGGIGSHAVGWSAAGLADYMGLPAWLSTPIGFGVPAIGEALKRGAGRSTNEAINDIRTITRQRSPVFEQTPFKDYYPDPTVAMSPRDRMTREMLRSGIFGGGQGMPIPGDLQRVIIDQPAVEEKP